MQNGEDLGENQSLKVDVAVRAMCEHYLKQCGRATHALRQLEQTYMINMVIDRWEQIRLAMYKFSLKVENAEKQAEKRQSRENS